LVAVEVARVALALVPERAETVLHLDKRLLAVAEVVNGVFRQVMAAQEVVQVPLAKICHHQLGREQPIRASMVVRAQSIQIQAVAYALAAAVVVREALAPVWLLRDRKAV
jgi:hypothetical protein